MPYIPPSIDEILADARAGRDRPTPHELQRQLWAGAWAIDIRPATNRDVEGNLPGAVVVDRLVMEWRLDPRSAHRMADGPGYDDQIVVICNEGYSSSLAARDLRELGFARATDLDGGFRAWAAAGLPITTTPTRYVS